jgi:hypothetical protein
VLHQILAYQVKRKGGEDEMMRWYDDSRGTICVCYIEE